MGHGGCKWHDNTSTTNKYCNTNNTMQATEPSRLLQLPLEILHNVWKHLSTIECLETQRSKRGMVSLHQCNRESRIATSKFITGLDLTIQCYYQEGDNDLRVALYGIDRFPRHASLKKLRLEFRQMSARFRLPDTSFYEMPSRFINQAADRLTALETLVLGTTWVGM